MADGWGQNAVEQFRVNRAFAVTRLRIRVSVYARLLARAADRCTDHRNRYEAPSRGSSLILTPPRATVNSTDEIVPVRNPRPGADILASVPGR